MNFKVSTGIVERPLKVVLYGVEGIGKTTFASKFPKPLFIDLDNGSARIDVNRIQGVETWEDLLSIVQDFSESTGNPYQTLVIDTADAAARLCEAYAIKTKSSKGQTSMEDFGYGRGYKILAEEFSKLMIWLERCVDRGYNVVVLAHAIMRTVTLPDATGNYDHWELKLPGSSVNKLGPLLKEWSDLLLFADYKTILIDANDGFGSKKKAKGGRRVMYTTHTPFADAKNRFGLDDMLDFDYDKISRLVPANVRPEEPAKPNPETKPEPKPEPKAEAKPKQTRKKKQPAVHEKEPSEALKKLYALMDEANIKEKDVIDALVLKGICLSTAKLSDFNDAFIETNLVAPWEGVKHFILETMQF